MRSCVASLAAFGLSHGKATNGLSTSDVMHGETAHGRAQHVCSPAECSTIHEKVLVMWCMARRHTDVPSTSVAPLNAIPFTRKYL